MPSFPPSSYSLCSPRFWWPIALHICCTVLHAFFLLSKLLVIVKNSFHLVFMQLSEACSCCLIDRFHTKFSCQSNFTFWFLHDLSIIGSHLWSDIFAAFSGNYQDLERLLIRLFVGIPIVFSLFLFVLDSCLFYSQSFAGATGFHMDLYSTSVTVVAFNLIISATPYFRLLSQLISLIF